MLIEKKAIILKVIAIIPARGGSKRLLNKNLLHLGEKSLLAHSIEYAKQNNSIISDVWVSTEDSKIAKEAISCGAKVINRSKKLAQDTTPTVEVIQDALIQINEKVNVVILLQPTNPLRPINLLKDAMNDFINKKADSLFTVTQNHQKLGKIVKNNYVPFNYKFGQRSQDLEPLYYENGLLYIIASSLIKKGEIMGENNIPYIVNHNFAKVDIDTQNDLDYAKFIYKNYKR